MTPDEFVRNMWSHAQAAGQELGVDPQTLIAHAALETGWGKSIPCNADGSCSYNLFGIKAGGKWQGDSVRVNTLEFEDGVAVRKRESFRAYASPADSFRDYAALLKNNPRYEAALGVGGDAQKFATALQRGGYATDPNYAQKLTKTALSVVERVGALLKSAAAQPITVGSRTSGGGRI
jgi:flagellar protein FlgJ